MSTIIEKAVEKVIGEKFGHVLEDLSFRINQTYELLERAGGEGRGRVFAEDLNLPGRAFMTGYVVTNNAPAAGSISWTDLHIVYSGTDYPITNANTNLKYAWWSPTTTPTVLQVSNTKPALGAGDVLIFMNSGGVAKVMLSDTNASLPAVVSDGAVDSTAILANAVGSLQLADGAVGSTQLGANAVTSGKLADGAVSRAGILGGSVVSTAALAANAVDGTKIADNAVTRAGQLGANVVDASKVANGAINRSSQLAANVVTTAELANNAVNNAKIAENAVGAGNLQSGAVGASKLDILRHVLY